MSTFKAKKELNSTIKRLEATGASKQEIGRVQYKLDQLMKGSKGTAVKSGGSVLKSKTGVVRQKDTTTKAPRKITKRVTPSATQPNNPFRTKVSAAPAAKIVSKGKISPYASYSKLKLRQLAKQGDKKAIELLRLR